jgi:hypothetical protein
MAALQMYRRSLATAERWQEMAVSLLKKPNDKPICAVVNEPQPEDQSLIGKIIVIKFGGNAVGNNAVIDRLIEETIALQNAGAHVIVVH